MLPRYYGFFFFFFSVGEVLTDFAIHHFVLYCKQSLCSTNQEMAELFASAAVKWALDKLSSLLLATLTSPAAAASNSQGELEDIRMLEMERKVQDKHYSIEAGMVPVQRELADRARKVIERFSEIKDYSDSFNLSENDGEKRIVPDIRSVLKDTSTSKDILKLRVRVLKKLGTIFQLNEGHENLDRYFLTNNEW
ncbi:hypothetical protein ABZP36_009837 [Zizania latifolia]